MSNYKKYIAKIIIPLDENFPLHSEYCCEETDLHYIITDNNGGKHPILKTGMLIKHFELWED